MELDIIKLQTTWNDAASAINSNFAKLLQAINAGVGNEGFNEEELRNFLESSGYTTEEWVLARGYITASSLVPYAKKEDLSSYATIAALSTLEGKHNVLRGEFDALYSLLNDDTTGVINTWNEVVDFINEYSGSQDLATILSGMNADISSRLLASDFESWKTNTFTPHANLVANHTTRLDGLDQSILSINTRIDGVDKTIEDHIAEFIAFRANFEITDNLILVRKNFASTEEVSAKGINQGTGGGGGSSYSRLDTWEGYDNNKAGYVLSAGLGYGLKVAIDELNGYDLDNRVRSIENSYVSKDAGGVVNGGLVVSSLAIAGGSSSQFLKADGSLDGTSYLSKNGGTISGKLTLKPQNYHAIDIVSPDNALAQITISTNDTLRGILQYNGNFGFGFSYSDVGGLYLDHDGVLKYVDSSLAKHPLLHEGNCDMYALSVWGGTLKGNLTLSESFLKITAYGKEYGYNVNAENGEPIYLKDNAWNTLIHSGNVGEYASLNGYLDGNVNFSTLGSGIYKTLAGIPNVPFDSAGNSIIHCGFDVNAATQLFLRYNYDELFYRRMTGGAWSDWKTIAFTDSNVASAQALKHSNGTVGATVDAYGGICLSTRGIWSADGGLSLFDYNEGVLNVGYSMRNSYITDIYGNTIRFKVGDTPRMLINSYGNVTIGDNDSAGSLNRFSVVGGANDYANWADLGQMVLLDSHTMTANYLAITTTNGGFAEIQAGQRNVGAKNIVLQKFGGNVGIGTASPSYKLDVIGDIRATESITIGGATLSWENGALKVNTSFYSEKEISAKGLSTGGGSGASYNRLDAWGDYDSSKAGYVLSAGLGYDLNTRLSSLSGVVDTHTSRLSSLENAGYITSSALSGYLPTSGGTINGYFGAFSVKRYEPYASAIKFENSVGILGYIGINDDYTPLIWDKDLNTRILLHSGNIASYALSTSGGTIEGNLTLGAEGSNTSQHLFRIYQKINGLQHRALMGILDSGDAELSYYCPDDYTYKRIVMGHGGFKIGGWELYDIIHSGNIGSQSVAYASNAGTLAGISLSNGSNTPWGTIPKVTEGGWMDVGKSFEFHYDNTTGSDYSTILMCTGNYGNIVNLPSASGTLALTTDNVASATKLATPRTIWGQSFDGTGNVDGKIYQNNKWILGVHSDGNLYMGFDTYGSNDTLLFGRNLYIFTSIGQTMTINSSGNVGIGTGVPEYKLDVNGQTRILKDNYGVLIGYDGNTIDGVYTSGFNQLHLNFNSPFHMSLCYGGGNVGVGTYSPSYKLHVDGTGYFSDAVTANGGLTVNGILTVGGASIHPTANNPYFQLYQNNKYWYWQADDNYTYIGGTMSKALRIDQSGNVLVIGTLGADGQITANNGLSVSKGLSASDGIVADWITAANITANTSATIAALTVSGLSTFTGGVVTNDIHGNGQSLYIGNASNNAYIKVREDMVGSSSMWSIPRDGKATFTSLTTPTLSVTGSATIASVTIDAGNATLSNLTVNTAATLKQLVVGIDGISCNGPATFNDFIYGSSITPRTDNYYVLGNNNYKWYAVTAYNVNVHDAITIEAGKELRFKDNNGVVHSLRYDSDKQAFVFDGNVNATGEMSAKKLNA